MGWAIPLYWAHKMFDKQDAMYGFLVYANTSKRFHLLGCCSSFPYGSASYNPPTSVPVRVVFNRILMSATLQPLGRVRD
jgi:hypothetical protein